MGGVVGGGYSLERELDRRLRGSARGAGRLGVGVAAFEGVDPDGSPRGPARTDDKAGGLLEVSVEPGEHLV